MCMNPLRIVDESDRAGSMHGRVIPARRNAPAALPGPPALDSSLPRVQKTASGTIVALPWSDFVDNRVLRSSPRDYYDAYVETFEYLRSHERLGLINMAAHGHFGGRPLMSAMVAKVVEHLKGQPDVWFTTHEEIARWFAGLGIERIPTQQRF